MTVTTVGYGDIVPESSAGRIIASVVMLAGVSAIPITTSLVVSVFVARAQAQQRERDADEREELMARLERIESKLDARASVEASARGRPRRRIGAWSCDRSPRPRRSRPRTARRSASSTTPPSQSLAEATLGPGQATQRHYHAQTEEIYYLTHGGGRLEVDGETRDVAAGDAALIPPGAWHELVAGPEGARLLCMCAPPVLPRRYVLRVRRLAPLLLVVLLLAALAAGCGGDDSGDESEAVEPATWAAGFCDALKTFTTGISEAGEDLAGEGLPSGEAIVDAIDNAADAASTFADDLRELGAPDVPSGEEISAELESAAREAGETFDAVKDEVGGEIDDAADVAVQAGKIAEAAQTALAGIGEATNRLQELDVEGRLTEALESASECADFGG